MSYNKQFMLRAIELAQRGEGFADPNPLVGCVLVRDGEVIGEGWHACYGAYHAERAAITHCVESGVSCLGAEVYVTLEPCCHHGKQPPCTDLLISQGVARVYVGITDPNPLVAGRGIALLRDAGIEVEVGFEEAAIREQNKAFLKLFTSHRPYVLMKVATTLDGKIATATGDSRWVTADAARAYVHHLRHQMMGIMVGIGTVEADDPMLNCRLQGVEKVSNPVRIVVDSTARIKLDSRLVQTAHEIPLIVAHTHQAPADKLCRLHDCGVTTLLCKDDDGQVSVVDLLSQLANPADDRLRPISSILLEGGARLNASFLKAGAVDEVAWFVAPKIVGGSTSVTAIGELGILKMSDALALDEVVMESIGKDILIKGKMHKQPCSQESLKR